MGFQFRGVRRRRVLGGGPELVGGDVGDVEHLGDVPDQRGGRSRNSGIQWQQLALRVQNLSEINPYQHVTLYLVSSLDS